MDNFSLRLWVLLTYLLFIGSAHAKESGHFTRNFWQPTYHGIRLNYCTFDGKSCGLDVATTYCKMMGYQRAMHHVIANNVGLTQYLYVPAKCVGWRCHGFKVIRCRGDIQHNPPQEYHYRLHRFSFPRYENYRVDWCYDGLHRCGRAAAYSFCRRMGYMDVRHFSSESQLPATKAIGNQTLCFGRLCRGFRQIDCYR